MVVMMTTEELDEGTEFFHEELFKDYPFFSVLNIFFERYPYPVLTSHIQEREGLKRSTIYLTLSRLEEKGLIQVIPDKTDRRKNKYLLSAYGETFLNNFLHFLQTKPQPSPPTKKLLTIVIPEDSKDYEILCNNALLEKKLCLYLRQNLSALLQEVSRMVFHETVLENNRSEEPK